jgi:hypothetical protein
VAAAMELKSTGDFSIGVDLPARWISHRHECSLLALRFTADEKSDRSKEINI